MGMRRIAKLLIPGALLVLAAAHLSTAQTQKNTDQDWPVYGQNAAQLRFAALDQINTGTVSRLGLAWYHQFDTDRGQQATPIEVGGKIYVSTAWSKVYAFDARTGQQLWGYDPQVPPETLPKGCCDAVNRGVSVADGRVFVSTLDGRLIALDQQTGKLLWSTVTVDQSKSYTSSGATYVAKNLVLIGNSGAEYGVRGYVSAYDVATGKLVWRFYTVPNPDGKPDGQPSDKPLHDLAGPTWFGNALREVGGGGTVWDSITSDPETGLLYIGVGNGGPYDRKIRSEGKGDNLFISSIVAVKAATGEYVWHYQTTPGDEWDFTATQHIMLVDGVIDGKPRKLLMQAPKNGFFYVLDRMTGELLSADAYAKVTWATGVDMKTGRPIEAPGARYGAAGGFVQYPSGLGAHSWHPMAYSPKTGLVYIPTQVMPMEFKADPNFRFRPGHVNAGVDTRTLSFPDDPKALAAIKSVVYGQLVAWDPIAKRARWSVSHPYFMNGGVLATAGGLVFQGTAEGKLFAYDAATGKELWSYPTVNGIIAPPISYSIDGRQYVAVMVGYGGAAAMYGTIVPDRPRLPGRLMVFALDGKAKAAAYDIPAPGPVDLTGVSSNGDAAAGLAAYNDNCMLCHGIGARSNFTRDLRRSEMIKDPENFKSIVIDGVFAEKGMVSFSAYLAPKDAENIRAYLIGEARKIASTDRRNK
jgi:quinohemoprotein ethanol dehydrogenase